MQGEEWGFFIGGSRMDYLKIRIISTIIEDPEKGFIFPIPIGKGSTKRNIEFQIGSKADDIYSPEGSEPKRWAENKNFYFFRGKVISVEGREGISEDELLLRIKHKVLREERILNRIKKEVEAFENFERLPVARRERIPESVRLFVWQRDEGKCIKCGSQEHLEFDHIIPIAQGGSNTERNVQLLCEMCNRQKGKGI